MSDWHSFVETADDDLECSTCSVVVCDQAIKVFTRPCPAPACEEQTDGAACVFVPAGRRGSECSYCGTAGQPSQDPTPDDEDA